MNGMIVIPYSDNVGYAIGRYIPTFRRALGHALGSLDKVSICVKERESDHYTKLQVPSPCVVAYDVYNGSSSEVSGFSEYLRKMEIGILMGLDVSPQVSWLRPVRRAGVAKVIAYWGAPMSSRNSGLKLLAKRFEVRWLRRSRPDLFIFESEAMRDLAVFGRGIPAADTVIVRTGVDVSKFHPAENAASAVYERIGIPKDRRVIVFMGHLTERKGPHILIQAGNILRDRFGRRDFHILFLGGGEEEARLLDGFEGTAQQEGFLTFAGYRDDVPELLSGCYVGCLPSSGWDSFPMSSLEMQACGLPVVASDLQGVPETIEAGRTGLVVRSGDALALAEGLNVILDDPILRANMSNQAVVRVLEKLTEDHQVANLSRVLKELIEKNPR